MKKKASKSFAKFIRSSAKKNQIQPTTMADYSPPSPRSRPSPEEVASMASADHGESLSEYEKALSAQVQAAFEARNPNDLKFDGGIRVPRVSTNDQLADLALTAAVEPTYPKAYHADESMHQAACNVVFGAIGPRK